jgi:prepilin-type N-terminal cleavage/methylation domain-containing protein
LCRIKASKELKVVNIINIKTKNMKREKGFTLIELLVVIAIIAILATLVLIALDGARESARDADRKGAISQIRSAAELYAADHDGSYSGMTLSEIGAPDTVQGNGIEIGSPSASGFCASIELSDGTHWCTDASLEVGESDDECSAAACPGF